MCQSRAQGGRRCVAHMAVTRAGKQIAAAVSGMKTEQLDSVFLQLRKEGSQAMTPGHIDLNQHVITQLKVLEKTSLDDKSKNRIKKVLLSSLQEHTPDAATFYAITRLNRESLRQTKNLRNNVVTIASDLKVTPSTIMKQFWVYYDAHNKTSGAIPDGYRGASITSYIEDVPQDKGTQYALSTLKNQAQEFSASTIMSSARIKRHSVDKSFVCEVGYDPEDGRVEFVFGTAPGVVHAYHNVPQDWWQQAHETNSFGALYHKVSQNNNYAYTSSQAAQEDAYPHRCSDCGQFAARVHQCPEIAKKQLYAAYDTPVEKRESVSDLRNMIAIEEYQTAENDQYLTQIMFAHEESHKAIIIRGEEALADIVNNGDIAVVRVHLMTSGVYSGNSYQAGQRVELDVRVYRDEQGWNSIIDKVDCACFDNEFGECSHSYLLSADTEDRNLANIMRDIVDHNRVTPEYLAKSTTYLETASNFRRVTDTPDNALSLSSSEVDTVEDVTGMIHKYDDDTVTVPSRQSVLDALKVGYVSVPVVWEGYRHADELPEGVHQTTSSFFSVSGTVTLDKNNGEVSVHRRKLRCECSQYSKYYHCIHVDYVTNQVMMLGADSQDGALRMGQFNEMATLIEQERRSAQWGSDEEYIAHMIARHAEVAPEDSYSLTYESFNRDLREAEEKLDSGENPLEYITENALGEEGNGRKFGVELEFDFAPTMSYQDRHNALTEIGMQLHAAKLTKSDAQLEYHAAQHTGYDKWSFEADGTVSGELVSPIMSDTPEDWKQLQQVCDILAKNGAIASYRTGSHVHVSTGSYGDSIEKHAELASIVNQHEDTIYRLSTNPDSEYHRPMEWCAPNAKYNEYSFKQVTKRDMSLLGSGHGTAINFHGATGRNAEKDNVEFRQWDGTLNPAVIQTQILLSVATVNAAERNVAAHGMSKIMREPVGTHYGRLSQEGDEEHDTLTTRNYIDTILSNREHKKRVTALFAMTHWQNNDSSDFFDSDQQYYADSGRDHYDPYDEYDDDDGYFDYADDDLYMESDDDEQSYINNQKSIFL